MSREKHKATRSAVDIDQQPKPLSIATSRARRRAGRSGMAVTGDSPEKQRGGMIGHCHGAADQAWSSAAVAAAVVFQTDRRRAAPYRPPPHSCLPGCTRCARGSSGLERSLQVAGPYREVKSAVAMFESEWHDVFSIHRRFRPARKARTMRACSLCCAT